jgi:hypothetical protein
MSATVCDWRGGGLEGRGTGREGDWRGGGLEERGTGGKRDWVVGPKFLHLHANTPFSSSFTKSFVIN